MQSSSDTSISFEKLDPTTLDFVVNVTTDDTSSDGSTVQSRFGSLFGLEKLPFGVPVDDTEREDSLHSESSAPAALSSVIPGEIVNLGISPVVYTNDTKGLKKCLPRDESFSPPSYETVLQQMLDELYENRDSLIFDDADANVAVHLRVRAARQKFQQLCDYTPEISDLGSLVRHSSVDNPCRKIIIAPGTVKNRKTLLLKLMQAKCRCIDSCHCPFLGTKNVQCLKPISRKVAVGRLMDFETETKPTVLRDESTEQHNNQSLTSDLSELSTEGRVSQDLEKSFLQKILSLKSKDEENLVLNLAINKTESAFSSIDREGSAVDQIPSIQRNTIRQIICEQKTETNK